MREGNLPKDSKCVVCKKSCWSAECLAGMRCEWCGVTAHAVCYRQMPKECDFGVLRKILLPPSSLTIPRTELPMEQLLAITSNDPPQSRKVSSPSKIQPDDVSSSGEDVKEREDTEILRVFDGNSSLRAQVCRTASVPKTATVQQIRDAALRRFHITDNPDNYYVTQVVNDGRRAQIFLRYKDDPDKDVVKLYGGWLRVPVTFCSLTVTRDTLVQDALADALQNFGLDPSTWNRYNLIEVSLDRGVAERTCNPQENMLQLVRNLRKAHAVCYRQMPKECDFGVLRKILLPPSSLTIPRTELPMEQLLAITSNDPPQSRKVSSPSKIQPDDVSSSGEDVKEREDTEILRVFDGNSSLRAQVCRTASVPKTATVQQIRQKPKYTLIPLVHFVNVRKRLTDFQDAALRRFHITDNPDNYYVTQVVND
ncbi:Ras association domain protein, partial [Ancylostoma duodenale]